MSVTKVNTIVRKESAPIQFSKSLAVIASEAKQSRLPGDSGLLRFARNDVVPVSDKRLPSRDTMCPSYSSEPPSRNKRAQGMPDARCTRGRVCNKKHTR